MKIENKKKIIENTTVLVTGGGGFIGSNLTDSLLEQNNKVICLDNFSSGKRANIEHQLKHPNFSLIEGDIRNLKTCLKACIGVEYILHHAALGAIPRSIKDPITTNEVNVNGFINMLIAARDNNVKRLVYASSSSIYGNNSDLPKKENKVGKPLSPYAVTKYTNELYAHVFYKTYGLETIGLRYFNIFGKRQDPDSTYAAVIPKFTHLLINQKSPTINGDGSFSRDFTHIDNIIQLNQLAAISTQKQAINNVFNGAYGTSISLLEMVKSLKNNLNEGLEKQQDIQLIFGPERIGDIKHSHADISLAKKLLEYTPNVNFEDGVNKYIAWYKDNYKYENKKK